MGCDIEVQDSTSNVPINECDGGKVNVISSSIDSHTKDDNDNICDTEIDKVTPNIPINKYDCDNIDTKVIGEENMKQPVEHDINDNIGVKVDVISSSIDNHTKDDNDNICDTEIDKVTPNIPINKYDCDNIDTKV